MGWCDQQWSSFRLKPVIRREEVNSSARTDISERRRPAASPRLGDEGQGVFPVLNREGTRSLAAFQPGDSLRDVVGLFLQHRLSVVEGAVVEEGPDLGAEKVDQHLGLKVAQFDVQFVPKIGSQLRSYRGGFLPTELDRLHHATSASASSAATQATSAASRSAWVFARARVRPSRALGLLTAALAMSSSMRAISAVSWAIRSSAFFTAWRRVEGEGPDFFSFFLPLL